MKDVSWFDTLKIFSQPAATGTIALVLGFLLFTPVVWLNKFGIYPLVEQYRPWIFIGFLFSLILSTIHLVPTLSRGIKKKLDYVQQYRTRRKRLSNLSKDEKDLLNSYIAQETKTQYFLLDDGVVRGLMDAAIIYQSSEIALLIDRRFAINIHEWAWEYLQKNPGLLEGASATYESQSPTAVIQKIFNSMK